MASKWEKTQTSNHIRKLHKAIIRRITGWGFNIWFSYAKKTKSRYFEVFVARHKIRIRLSDHVSHTIREFDYDIWVNKPRPNAFSYEEWVKDMEGKINAIMEQEKAW
jgi:hypothetical protein